RLADALEVYAHFERGLAREEALGRMAEIADWPQVEAVEFVSREEGWEQFKSKLASGGKLDGLDNPVTDCVRVRVANPELLAEVSANLARVDGVSDVVP
ncbi:MAG: hypothetical protein GTN78_17730, partial [Gemmatimonadales bacterium]|nr:hypothetical protein [Gemmatimonadales bacterium]